MADEDHLIRRSAKLPEFIRKRLERLMAAPRLASGNQPALRVHMQHRLDLEHGTKECR